MRCFPSLKCWELLEHCVSEQQLVQRKFLVYASASCRSVCILVYLEVFMGNWQVLDHSFIFCGLFWKSWPIYSFCITLRILIFSTYNKIDDGRLGRSFIFRSYTSCETVLWWNVSYIDNLKSIHSWHWQLTTNQLLLITITFNFVIVLYVGFQ